MIDRIKKLFRAEPEHRDVAGEFDKYSPTWVYLKDILNQEIADLRIKNDKPLDSGQTAVLRGQIKMCKRLLEIEKEPGGIIGTRFNAPADR